MLTFAVAVGGAHHILSTPKTDFFGTTMGAQIGWGLWLLLIASVALVVTTGIVVKQASKKAS